MKILFCVLRGNQRNRPLRHRSRIMVNLGQRTTSLEQRFWRWTKRRELRKMMVRIGLYWATTYEAAVSSSSVKMFDEFFIC